MNETDRPAGPLRRRWLLVALLARGVRAGAFTPTGALRLYWRADFTEGP